MTAEERKLFEDLRHDLVTMDNMGAFDLAKPDVTFRVNNSALIKRIDDILGDGPREHCGEQIEEIESATR